MKDRVANNDNFFERVYEIVRLIPEGKVTSYGAIAKALGAARSARMVGWAMNASHNKDDVPAHRVVNRKGLLSGKHHFDGTNLMQQLLENEGIPVKDNQIVDFEKYFWEPKIPNNL
ncbi:MGMT family protein [Flavobacterium sp. J27]|uniref:MGMT family protein n=1 Tax=Flavobacterium sp. J27 TaxID=2060419 RepID=UPI0010324C20|nr:MGMT family protein [Flavobacterium sp. J27]